MNTEMKKYIYILFAALLCMALACNKKEAPYVPGEPDVDGCYGVYFPDQDAAKTHYFAPEAEKTVTITVKRTNANGAIDVPVVLKGEDTDVFDVEAIHFDDAQEETTFTVELSEDAEKAKDFPLTIEIQDPLYASKYSKNNAFFNMSAMIVRWETMGTFTLVQDGYWGEGITFEIVYYEVEGVRYCKSENERDRHALSPGGGISPDGGFWGTGEDYHLNFNWYPNLQNAQGYDYVGLIPNDMGYPHASYGTRYYADNFYYYKVVGSSSVSSYATIEDYIKANNPLGLVLSYYDPRGELHFTMKVCVTAGNFGTFDLVAYKEGYVPTDYSLSLSSDVSKDGKVPVTVTTGADVASLNYAIYEGELGNAALKDHVAAIVKGEEETTKLALTSTVTVLDIALEESGVYTLIALPANAKGELQAEKYASISFNYLAPGDENPVVANAGLDPLSDKYKAQGYDPETALEAWIYGKEITTAKLVVLKKADYEKESESYFKEYTKTKGTALTAAQLETLNGTGFSVIVTKLLPGTPYKLIAYLSNGYEETWLYADATTKGDPDPLTINWTAADFVSKVTKSKFVETDWDLYGRKLTSKGYAAERAKLGVIEVEDGGEVEGEDIVLMKGLSLGAGEYYGFDDTFEGDVYNGLIYGHSNEYGMVTIGGTDYFINAEYHVAGSEENQTYTIDYALIGAYVEEGLIAMVAYPNYISKYGITFDGVVYQAWKDDTAEDLVGSLSGVLDIIFADPDVFPTPNAAAAAISRSSGRIEALKSLRGGYLEAAAKGDVRLRDVNNSFALEIPFEGKAVNATVTVSEETPKTNGRINDELTRFAE